eukprot:9700262-Lingulodinium_polyedra.AAC.1
MERPCLLRAARAAMLSGWQPGNDLRTERNSPPAARLFRAALQKAWGSARGVGSGRDSHEFA